MKIVSLAPEVLCMAARSARDDEVDRDLRQGPRQDRPRPARRPASGRVFVEGLNIVKRHQRPTPGRPDAPVGVIEQEGPIHISNVTLLDPKDK